MVKNATDENLRAVLEAHLGETETQVERLGRAFELMDEPARGKPCAGMQGIIEEGSEHMSEEYETDELLDVVIVAAAQRVEHYEIAAYGNAIAHAKQLGMTDLASLLEESLNEEKAADEKLTEVGEPLNAAAQTAGQAGEGADDERAGEESEPGNRSASLRLANARNKSVGSSKSGAGRNSGKNGSNGSMSSKARGQAPSSR